MTSATVHGDGEADWLEAGGGLDWIFAEAINDIVAGARARDRIVVL